MARDDSQPEGCYRVNSHPRGRADLMNSKRDTRAAHRGLTVALTQSLKATPAPAGLGIGQRAKGRALGLDDAASLSSIGVMPLISARP